VVSFCSWPRHSPTHGCCGSILKAGLGVRRAGAVHGAPRSTRPEEARKLAGLPERWALIQSEIERSEKGGGAIESCCQAVVNACHLLYPHSMPRCHAA
jgi:hypothetical protein